ncbi:hypothetical protein GEMRC1_006695 [Eukaryota sp. GEM-RC1]
MFPPSERRKTTLQYFHFYLCYTKLIAKFHLMFSALQAVSECMKLFNDAEELPIDAFFHDVSCKVSPSTSSLAIERSGDTQLVDWLQGLLPSFGLFGTAKVHHGDVMLSHRMHLLRVGTFVDHMITLSSHLGSYLLLPINKGTNSSNSYGVRQVAIECVNAIVSNTIMLGMPQDHSVYGLIIIGTTRPTTLRVVRVRKVDQEVNQFHVAVSPELSTKDSSKDFESTSAWISRLLIAVTAYGMIIEKALQEQRIMDQSLTLTHLRAYDGYEDLLKFLEDTDKWIVVNATPCKATVVKFDEDGFPVKFGCVNLGSPTLRIIKHPRGRGPQWTMTFPRLFAVADPGGVNILKFDTSPSPNSIRLDQFVLLALDEILDVQQFDNVDSNVKKMVHGDTRLPNFLYNSDNGTPSLCLIDFEYSSSAHARQTLSTSARADRPQIPPPLRFQRANAFVPLMPSDDFYMFLYSLLLEIDFSCQTSVIRGKIEFGYDDFPPCISELAESSCDSEQRHLFVELLRPIAPNPPPEYQTFRKQGERRENFLVYEDQLYRDIRRHCERIRNEEFAKLSFYGHPSELFVLKRSMGSRVVMKSMS